MGDEQERIHKYEVEIARLDELFLHLEGLWKYVPRYALLGLLAPIVWYFAGFGWALTELLVTGALVGTQAYLIGMRKNENRWNRELIVRDLAKLREELAARR
jgi:hypothetical protein